jgi:hypothetical protein
LSDTLGRVLQAIAAAPESSAALTLYALVSTMDHEQAGCLFKLVKLRDLSATQRELAYALIEMMAQGRNAGTDWRDAKRQMDELIRGS